MLRLAHSSSSSSKHSVLSRSLIVWQQQHQRQQHQLYQLRRVMVLTQPSQHHSSSRRFQDRLGSIRTAAVNGSVAPKSKVNGIAAAPNGSSSSGKKKATSSHHHHDTIVEGNVPDHNKRRIMKSLLNTLQQCASLDTSGRLQQEDDDDETWEIEVEVYVDHDDDEEEEVEAISAPSPAFVSSNELPVAVMDNEVTPAASVEPPLAPPPQQQQQPSPRPIASRWKGPVIRYSQTTTTTSATTNTTTTSPATSTTTAPVTSTHNDNYSNSRPPVATRFDRLTSATTTNTTTAPATHFDNASNKSRPPLATRFNRSDQKWIYQELIQYHKSKTNYHHLVALHQRQQQREQQQQQQQQQLQQDDYSNNNNQSTKPSLPPSPSSQHSSVQAFGVGGRLPHGHRRSQASQRRDRQHDHHPSQQQLPQQYLFDHLEQQQQPYRPQQQQLQRAPQEDMESWNSTVTPSSQPSRQGEYYYTPPVSPPPPQHQQHESSLSSSSSSNHINSTSLLEDDLVIRSIRTASTAAAAAASDPVIDPAEFTFASLSPRLPEWTEEFGNHQHHHSPESLYGQPQQQPSFSSQQQHHPQPQYYEQHPSPQPHYEQQQQSQPQYEQQPQHSHRPVSTLHYREEVPNRHLHSERMRPQNRPPSSIQDNFTSSSSSLSSPSLARSSSKPSSVFDISKRGRDKDETTKLEERLMNAIRLHQIDRAMSIFDDSRSRRMVLSEQMLCNLFFCFVDTQPVHAYQVLKYMRFHYYKPGRKFQAAAAAAASISTDDDDATDTTTTTTPEPKRVPVEMYRRMCKSIRLLDPVRVLHRHIRGTISPLLEEVRNLPMEEQKACLPFLLSSLVEQRGVDMGRQAQSLYHYMLEHQFPLTDKYFEHLLFKSKYTRQDDLPYHDILRQLVQRGGTPAPSMVAHVLQNQFPFTDGDAVSSILQSMIELQKRKSNPPETTNLPQVVGDTQETNTVVSDEAFGHNDEFPKTAVLQEDYIFDLGMLQHIAAAAARNGKHNVILLVWDVLDLMKMEATESIYESTIHAFIKGYSQDANAFAVLSEMESKGYQPSRALTRSMSLSLRYVKCYFLAK